MPGISKQYLRNNYAISEEFSQGDSKSHKKWPPYLEMHPLWDPRDPKVTLKAPKVIPRTPTVPQSDPPAPKVSPRSLKLSQRWSQVVPRGLPGPPKIDKKRVQDHPGTPLRKWTSPRCENPIFYYVFEVAFCENPIIYYVLKTSRILSFLKSDENTAPATLLEPPKKPVLAREREARLFF
jgi:hypothetical protein